MLGTFGIPDLWISRFPNSWISEFPTGRGGLAAGRTDPHAIRIWKVYSLHQCAFHFPWRSHANTWKLQANSPKVTCWKGTLDVTIQILARTDMADMAKHFVAFYVQVESLGDRVSNSWAPCLGGCKTLRNYKGRGHTLWKLLTLVLKWSIGTSYDMRAPQYTGLIPDSPPSQEGTLNIIQKETSKTIARGSNAQLELADLAGCFEYRPWRAYMSQQGLLATSLIPGGVRRGGQVRIWEYT